MRAHNVQCASARSSLLLLVLAAACAYKGQAPPLSGEQVPPTATATPSSPIPTDTAATVLPRTTPRPTPTAMPAIQLPKAGFSYVPLPGVNREEADYSVTFTATDGEVVLVLIGWQDQGTEIGTDAEAVALAKSYLPEAFVIAGFDILEGGVVGDKAGTELAIHGELSGRQYQGALIWLNPIPGQSFIEAMIAPSELFQKAPLDYFIQLQASVAFLPPPKLPPDPALRIVTTSPTDQGLQVPTAPPPLGDAALLTGLVFRVAPPSEPPGTWVFSQDGSLHQLADASCYLDISPGGRLAIRSSCEGDQIIDLKTGEVVRTPDIGDVSSWSSDSTSILFARDRDIWSFDIRSGTSRNLTHTSERTEYFAEPWPGHEDGLILYSWPSSMDEGIGEGWVGHLTSLSVETGDYTVISSQPLSQLPAVSPLGQSIVYDNLLYRYPSGSQPFPFQNYGLGDPEFASLYSPRWSPNGRYLAGWYANSNPRAPYAEGYVIIDWEAGSSTLFPGLLPLVSPGWPDYPDWSPDSTRLLLMATVAGTSQARLWLINAISRDIHSAVRLASPDYAYCSTLWSPDSLRAAIQCSDPALAEGVFIFDVPSFSCFNPELPDLATIVTWRTNLP